MLQVCCINQQLIDDLLQEFRADEAEEKEEEEPAAISIFYNVGRMTSLT